VVKIEINRGDDGQVGLAVHGQVTESDLIGLLEITKASVLATLVKGPPKEAQSPILLAGRGLPRI
jgi:hypothetical protein